MVGEGGWKTNQTVAPDTSTVNGNRREEDQPYMFGGKTSDFCERTRHLEAEANGSVVTPQPQGTKIGNGKGVGTKDARGYSDSFPFKQHAPCHTVLGVHDEGRALNEVGAVNEIKGVKLKRGLGLYQDPQTLESPKSSPLCGGPDHEPMTKTQKTQ